MAEKVIIIADSITVGELAEKLNLPVTSLVGELFKNGIMATINQRIDFETASIILEELGISDVTLERKATTSISVHRTHEISSRAVARPPIVAVMGHVDHGKTSLLDSILKTKAVEGEAGGITQHISAYQTVRNNRVITLLDTPGHEAFAALRQHGAALTDVVIIVVAADDGVKPQTIEAIKFARAANAKIVVAINKMDKESANPGLVKGQLAEQQVISDDKIWSGDIPMVEVSAKTGQNIGELLDTVLLVADLEDLRADVDVPADGLVIESHMEVGRGPVVGLLVQRGILKPSHFLVAGTTFGKVRTLLDFSGKPIKEASPSTPVVVTGFKELPQFGDTFMIVKSEKEARQQVMASRIEQEKNAASTNITGADLLKMINQQYDSKDLNVIVKADVQGSLTSVVDSLRLIDTAGEINLHIISSGVGNINENDIRMIADKDTIIYGFNVDISNAVKQLAYRDGVKVKTFKVIYELLDDAKLAMEALLPPKVVETEIGKMIIKGIFRTLKDEIIAGGEVTKGKIIANAKARVMRDKVQIGEVLIEKVQRQQQEAKEVFEGEMCGISLKLEKRIVLEEGDKLEVFSRELIKRTLA